MEGIVRVVFGFAIMAVLFWLIETIWPEDRNQPRWRSDSFTDLIYWIFDGIVTKFITTVAVILAIITTALMIPRSSGGWVTSQPLWLQALEILVLGDLIGYWVHRLFHRLPSLWRIHAVHHSPVKLDWLAAARFHPLDSVAHRVAATVPLYLLGFSGGVLALYAPFLAIYPIFIHANVSWNFGPLKYFITSPEFHRWHHSSDQAALDKNFSGLFPFFDYLFGTAYMPKNRRPQKYGLNNEIMPDGILPQLLYPFRKTSAAPNWRTTGQQTQPSQNQRF
jgi:sterol desaturase/sphingolipid hydroxylase (fatty acid hydroxylase superfamily)